MYGMFSECINLVNLDLSNFNTNNVINMSVMFNACESLKYLNLSNFNTKNVKNIFYIFDDTMKGNCKLICNDNRLTKMFYY